MSHVSKLLIILLVAMVLVGCGQSQSKVSKEYGKKELKAEMQEASKEMNLLLQETQK